MKTKYYLQFLTVVSVLLIFSNCNSEPKNSKENAPNIIIFFTDDQGYGDVGCYGASGYETPNFDALAREGIRFTNFYVPATVCTPSRAGLLTGKYPKRVGLHEAVLFPYSEGGLSPDEYTMAEMLKEGGYVSSCIGKWHLGHKEEFMPNNQGFDYFFGVPYSNDMNNHYYKHNDFQSPPLPVFRNREKIEEDPDQRYLTRRYTEEVVKRIKSEKDHPFFIYLAHNMPHTPLYVSEKYDGASSAGLYGDVIMELDWSLGEIVKTLKEEGIYENTVIIFTSDNGPVERAGGSSGGLRGQKAQTWEGGQRVPGIITWPNKIPQGKVSNEVLTTLDIFPTLAHIAGVDLPEDLTLDGRNIIELLRNPDGSELTDQPFYYYARNGELEAVRLGDWKLNIFKSIGWDQSKNGEFPVSLFNLRKDVGETQNLADKYPAKVRIMTKLISDFDKEF